METLATGWWKQMLMHIIQLISHQVYEGNEIQPKGSQLAPHVRNGRM